MGRFSIRGSSRGVVGARLEPLTQRSPRGRGGSAAPRLAPRWQTARDQRGFTLAELLVVTAVVGLVLAAVLLLQKNGQDAYLMGSSRVATQQNARVALELMVRELRSAQSVTALGGAADVTFLSDHDNNPATPSITIRYALAGATLNRTEGGGVASPLIGGVEALAMTYCDVWNAPTNTCTTVAATVDRVKLVRIQLVTRTEDGASAGSFGDQRATMESTVRLRSL